MKTVTRVLVTSLVTLAFLLAASQIPRMLGWYPDQGTGLDASYFDENAKKLVNLSATDRVDLIKDELRRLRQRPLDQEMLKNLSILALSGPAGDVSGTVVKQLASVSLRNSAVQLVAIRQLLTEKNLAEALYRIDGVLRAHPRLSEQLFPVLAVSFSEADGSKLVAKVLASKPPWRESYFRYLAEAPGQQLAGLELLRSLKGTRQPATAPEMNAMFSAWLKRPNGMDFSYFAWLDLLAPEDLTLVKGIFDGGFARDTRGLPFEWSFWSGPNARVSIVLKPGSGTDRALLVDFSNSREWFFNVSQHVQLSPGEYEFSYDVMSQSLQTEGGLVWRVYCAEKMNKLAESTAVAFPSNWERQTIRLQIPSTDCSTQLLRLESKAIRGPDLLISGQIYYDSLAVRPALQAETP